MRWLSLACLLLLAAPLHAAEPVRLQLAESVEREVDNDRFHARFEGRSTAPTAAAAQTTLNARMATALERVRTVAAVTATTGGYGVRRVEPEDEAPHWIATQDLLLETGTQDALLALVGELQADDLLLQGLSASLSRDTAEALRDELTREAIGLMLARAEMAAAALGLRFTGWIEVVLDGASPAPRMLRAQAMAADAANVPPVLEGGTSTVRASVSGTAGLEP